MAEEKRDGRIEALVLVQSLILACVLDQMPESERMAKARMMLVKLDDSIARGHALGQDFVNDFEETLEYALPLLKSAALTHKEPPNETS